MTTSFENLLVKLTQSELLAKALEIATALGLPVTSWAVGDPTRVTFTYEAEILETLDNSAADFAGSATLDTAEGEWLRLKAKEDYDVDFNPATNAITTVTLSNSGGGEYVIDVNSLSFRNSVTGKTYHNTTAGTLSPGPGTTLDVTVEADEPGSDSSALAGEISELVTSLNGVTCTNDAAATGEDVEDPDALRARCRAETGAVSPNGPRDAYQAVALNKDLTGPTAVTRARSIGDSDTGDVYLYLAGASGPLAEADRAAVEDAILLYATPICITPTVAVAEPQIVDISYTLYLYRGVSKTLAEVQSAVATALARMFAARPIGGDIIPPNLGKLYRSLIAAEIKAAFPGYVFRVEIVTPATDEELLQNQVAVLGTLTASVSFLEDP